MRDAVSAHPAAVALGFALLHLAIVHQALIPTLHFGGDNAAYLALAESLRGGGYRELWDPAARSHTQYPPGFPLMLASAMTLGVKPWVGFKVLVGFFAAAAVGLSYLWARRVAGTGTALGVAAILTVGPGVVDQGRWELSDPPFWAMTMLALWAFARLAPADDRHPDNATPAPRRTWIAPIALAAGATLAAYVTRSAGLPLVVAAGGWLAWRRRWPALALFAATIAPFGLWWWLRGRTYGAPGYTSFLWYVDPYRPLLGRVDAAGFIQRVASNIGVYTGQHLPSLLTGWITGAHALLLGAAVVLLALAGWIMRMRRPGVAEVWLALYMGLVLVWPREWAGERFLLPALPMLLVCAAEPVRRAAARVRMPALAGGAAVLVLILAMPTLRLELVDARLCRAEYSAENPYPCLKPETADLLGLAAHLRGRLPQGSAVLVRKPTLFWSESGYAARVYPFSADPDTLVAAARQAGANYVLLDYTDAISTLYLAPVLMQRPQAFCVMRALGPGRAALLAIRPGAERMPNLRGRPGAESADVPFSSCPREFWEQRHPAPPPG